MVVSLQRYQDDAIGTLYPDKSSDDFLLWVQLDCFGIAQAICKQTLSNDRAR